LVSFSTAVDWSIGLALPGIMSRVQSRTSRVFVTRCYSKPTRLQNGLGVLRWIVELGRIDIMMEVSMLLAQPHCYAKGRALGNLCITS